MCDKCVNHCHENKGCEAKYKAVHGFKSRLNGKLLSEDGILPIDKVHELAAVLSDAYTFLLIDDGVRVEIVKASAFGTQVKIERGIGQTVPSDFNIGACVLFEVFDFGQGDCSHSNCACHDDVNGKGAVRVIAPVDYRVNVHFNVNHSGDLTKIGQGLIEILKSLISAANSNNNNQSSNGVGSGTGTGTGSGGGTNSGTNTSTGSSGQGTGSGGSAGTGSTGGTGNKDDNVFIEVVNGSSSGGSGGNHSDANNNGGGSTGTGGGSGGSSDSKWNFDATTILPRG